MAATARTTQQMDAHDGTMLDQIIAALERHPGVHDWTVMARRERSLQVYLLADGLENVREVATHAFEVSVLNDHPWPAGGSGSRAERGEHARGQASVKLVPADTGSLAQRIEEAVTMAQLVHNPPYQLAAPAAYPSVPLADGRLASTPGRREAAREFAEVVRAGVAAEAQVRLSAAELFLTYEEIELRTSRGVAATADQTGVLVELALLTGDPARPLEEAEFFQSLEGRRFSDLRLSESVRETATYARDTLRARTPRTRAGPVVLSGEALAPLFDAFTYQAAASTAYNKLSRLEVGQRVYGDRAPAGDPLTLRLNALRPYGYASHAFDSDGVPGRDVLLVQDGVLRARQASQRYAQYLGVPATGQAGNTDVAPGTHEMERLLGEEGPVLHVVTFSFPDVDPVTGDFGWEIRLGYEVDGHSVRPVKGGSVSGNIFDAFADVRFSQETIAIRDYVGPGAARFASLSVSGD